MSMRRFVAYFLAISAGSTVAFASTLIGRPASTEAVKTEAAVEAIGVAATERAAWLLQERRSHPRPKPFARVAEVASVKYGGR